MQNSNKHAKPNDDRANVKNPNNLQHDKANGNKGKQLNPNQEKPKGK